MRESRLRVATVRAATAVSVSALLLGACFEEGPSAGTEARALAGEWGGEHARLDVTETGGRVEFDCAHGSLDAPLDIDTAGRFAVPGTLVLEGGPVRLGQEESRRSVRYAGRIRGFRMDLEMSSETQEPLGSFVLEFGRPALLLKCL